jgi:DNA (cytosine-5)-methyltransferase 1
MINKNTVLDQTLNRIKEYCEENLPDLYAHTECDAIITHLLQSPSHSVPYLKDNEKKLLLTYIKKSPSNPSKAADEQTSYVANKNIDTLFPNTVPFSPPEKPKFTFIDLFAGIGGFRQAMQSFDGKCVFSSEWDKYAKQTYFRNYGEVPYGDIRKIDEKSIPDHDVLCAGFPCQAFSIAGKRKGFEETRGTLFFEVARIIKEKQPKAFFLENVKGLKSHNKGQTLKEILKVLRGDKEDGYLNYYVPDPHIFNAKDFGVPQHRERIFIVGFRKDILNDNFEYPKPLNINVELTDIIEKKEVSVKYYLSTTYLQTLKAHKARHASKGNGFGYEILDPTGISNAIVCGGMGRERNLLVDNKISDYTPITHIKGEVSRENVRRMTPREWARLQGYSEDFVIPVSDAQAFKQFGNSVAVPAIKEMARKIVERLKE